MVSFLISDPSTSFALFQTLYMMPCHGLHDTEKELVVGVMFSMVVCDKLSCFIFSLFCYVYNLYSSLPSLYDLYVV